MRCPRQPLIGAGNYRKDTPMPLVDIQLIKGVFDAAHKSEMIAKVTEAMVQIEGEAMRPVTWVRVIEVDSGSWAIGGQALSADDVKAMQKQKQRAFAQPDRAPVRAQARETSPADLRSARH